MRCAHRFRLYPTRDQGRELRIMLETHRRLYNACLAQRKQAYAEEGISLGYCAQSSWFKDQREVNPWFARLNFSSAQATMRRLDRSFSAFFWRVKVGQKPGYPRFKTQGRFTSVEFPAYRDGIRLKDGKLRVQHVGFIKCKVHRTVEGVIKTATLKFDGDKWHVILSCDLGEVRVPPSQNPPVGIDVGIESFLTTSDGIREPNPQYLKVELPTLRRAGRAVSRKKKAGKNRTKAIRKLRRLHARVKNLRHEHHHKTALKLVRRYGLIAVEGLNITGMLRNRRVSRAIADAAWSGFVATLRYKAERAGAEVVEVNAQGTSQACSRCGTEVRKSLSVRTHRCSHCGLSLHRDENAARNILARALLARTGPTGVNGKIIAVA